MKWMTSTFNGDRKNRYISHRCVEGAPPQRRLVLGRLANSDRLRRIKAVSILIAVAWLIVVSLQPGIADGQTLEPELGKPQSRLILRGIFTAQMEGAVDLLEEYHRCGYSGGYSEGVQMSPMVERYAGLEAYAAARALWPTLRGTDLAARRAYWDMQRQLVQIQHAPEAVRRELICDPEFEKARSRWRIAAFQTADDPLRQTWRWIYTHTALSRAIVLYAAGAWTTCHSLGAIDRSLTSRPWQAPILEYALIGTESVLRGAPVPRPRDLGASLLWDGIKRAARERGSEVERFVTHGEWFNVCGHVFYQLAWGTYFSWLQAMVGVDGTPRLNAMFRWAQIETAMRTICQSPDRDTVRMAGAFIDAAMHSPRATYRLNRGQGGLAEDVSEWLPAPGERNGDFAPLSCPWPLLSDIGGLLAETERALHDLHIAAAAD